MTDLNLIRNSLNYRARGLAFGPPRDFLIVDRAKVAGWPENRLGLILGIIHQEYVFEKNFRNLVLVRK